MVAAITKPNYLNVFLGRVGAYIKNNGLGDGSGAGERTVISTQRWISELTRNNPESTKLIAASLRSHDQLAALAGVNVFTIPTKVATDGREKLDGQFQSRLNEVYPVDLVENATQYFPEKLWDVSSKELKLAKELDENCPETGYELIKRAHAAGCGDMFPVLSDNDLKLIA